MEVLGAVDASYGLVGSAYTLLVQLRECWKNSKDVAEKLDELRELAQKTEDVVKSITAKVNSYPQNALEPIASGVIDVLQSKVDRNVKGAMAALKKLERYQKSSAGPSSGVARMRSRFRTSRIGLTAKLTFSKDIPEALREAESCLDKALQEASNVELHRFNMEIHRKLESFCLPQPKEDCFVPHFDCPELPDNVVLDFGSTETQEGRLLRKLLELREKESAHGMSALGCSRGSATHGMGGVGKTTALRAICYQETVKEAFPDGICFLEFTQNAKDCDIQHQLERCIENFGGVSVATKMEGQSSLEGAVNHAAGWLRAKATLFVCDDMWGTTGSEFGHLRLLKRLLRFAPRSKLLISTRDKRIAEEVSMNYETFGTLPSHGPSARNLLCRIAFGDEHAKTLNRPDVLGDFETILNVCSGLQLALCMAGRALRTAIQELGDIQKGFEVYASQVQRDQRPDETERGAQLYDHGLTHIVEASLVQCELWATKSLKHVNVHDLFRSLCVLEKQMVMPKSVLSNLWGLSSRETDHVVRKFADLGLITKTKGNTLAEPCENETVEDYGVRLHELILVLCQEMAWYEQEERHASVIDALKRSKSVWIGEQVPMLDEWWRLKSSGYIFGNLSRHMVKCGRRQALANLLSDVRWTLRRVEVGGWVALKTDFELLLADGDDAEFAEIKQIYQVLERHWSEVSKDERFLPYYIGGSLSREEHKNKHTVLYTDSIMRYLSRPFLVPRSKFLGPQDSREVSLLTCLTNPIFVNMDFSRATDRALVEAMDKISIWSVSAQKELSSFCLPPNLVKSALYCVAISADGRLIVTGHDDGTFKQWNAESGEPVRVGVKAHNDSVTCLAISNDGSTIVTGSKDKTLRLWSVKNGTPKGMPMNHEDAVTCVAICEGGSMIVSGSKDNTVCRWDIETTAMIGKPMHGHKNWVRCVSVDKDGKMIVSGSRDKTLFRWDAETGKQIGEPMCGHSQAVLCVAISSCGKMIVSGSWDHTLQTWDTTNGKPMGEPFQGHTEPVTSVRFAEESKIIVSGSQDGTIRRWRTVSSMQTCELTRRSEEKVRHIVFSDDGRRFVSCSTNGTILQWDANTKKPIGKPMVRRRGGVVSIVFNEKLGMILALYCT